MKLARFIIIGFVIAALLFIALSRPKKGSNSKHFRMIIDDVFALKTEGSVVVVGVVSDGEVMPGDALLLESGSNQLIVDVEGLETFHKPIERAKKGDRIGILLRGLDKDQVSPGGLLISSDEKRPLQ